jgi:hypothetical protein
MMIVVSPLLAHVAYVKMVVYLLKILRTRPREDEALVVLSFLVLSISYSYTAKVQLTVEWIGLVDYHLPARTWMSRETMEPAELRAMQR